jgi:tetratricopeptide (TPR) repeat protein
MKLKTRYNLIKRGLYLLLLLALPLFSLGDDNEALFKQGNTAYSKGQYQQAIKVYQQVVDGGYQSAVVYFNLGNAYYKQGDIPSALLYYEKAHKLAPGDEDINFNIHYANLKTTDKVEAAPEFFVTQWWHGLVLFFSVNTLSILSILAFVAGFLILILYLFSNSSAIKRASFYVGVLMIFLGLTFIFMANRQINYFSGHHQAIIFSGSVIVKSTPDANAKPLFVVHEGTKVDVLQTNNSWIEVQLPNGAAGWITANDVKEI